MVELEKKELQGLKQSKWWIIVTHYSKYLAIILLIFLPFLGFYLGLKFQKDININTASQTDNSAEESGPEVQINPTRQLNNKNDSITGQVNNENGDWIVYSEKPFSNSPGYSLKIPEDSNVCEHAGDGPPINFGKDYTINFPYKYCYHGIYVNKDKIPYGLLIDYTVLPEDSAKQGLFKDEYENGVKSDLDFGRDDAVMLNRQQTINIHDAQTGTTNKEQIFYTRYVIPVGEFRAVKSWFMFTIQTDLGFTNLDLYKQILSTFKFTE